MPLKYIPELSKKYFPSNAGVYVISEDPPTKNGPKKVKIGRSIDIRKRLNSYHICFPEGFHIWMVMKLSPETTAVPRKARLQATKVLESRVFAELVHLNLVNDARRFHEYFVIRTDQDLESLKEAVERVTLNGRPVTEWPPVTEWKKGTQYDEFLIDGEKVLV